MNKSLFNRREMLKVGALGGLSLSHYLKLQAATKSSSPKRSGIFVFLEGGPSHQDTFDLKPDAPSEYRGDFKPISTSVPGIQICEHLPELAKRMKDYAIIRGLSHTLADHGIGKGYAGEVTPHSLLPLVVLLDPLMPAPASMVPAVEQIVFLVSGQLHLVQRIHVEIFGGHLPGDVRSENARGDKKRFVALLLHFRLFPAR